MGTFHHGVNGWNTYKLYVDQRYSKKICLSFYLDETHASEMNLMRRSGPPSGCTKRSILGKEWKRHFGKSPYLNLIEFVGVFFQKTRFFDQFHFSLNHDGANGIFVLNVQLIILGFWTKKSLKHITGALGYLVRTYPRYSTHGSVYLHWGKIRWVKAKSNCWWKKSCTTWDV